jgi:hypothetical protein
MMDYDPNYSEDLILNILKGYLRPLIRYRVIKPLPDWYNDYMYETDYRSYDSQSEIARAEDMLITFDGNDSNSSMSSDEEI